MDAIAPWHFDPSGVWLQGAGRSVIRPTSTLTLATFNVWFGEHESQARTHAMLGLLRHSQADVIALQEVTPALLQRICSEDWVRREYFLSDVNGTTFSRYGTLLLSRLPVRVFEIHELPTMMSRTLLLARVDLGSQELAVACVHLESLHESAWYREEQLRLIFKILDPEENAVVMGDFNFCSSWPESALLDRRYSDLWPLSHPDAPGWTVDTNANRMRQVLGLPDKSVRFDRILLRAEPALLNLRAMDLLGNGPISPVRPDLYPSDHFGLLASFKVALPAPPSSEGDVEVHPVNGRVIFLDIDGVILPTRIWAIPENLRWLETPPVERSPHLTFDPGAVALLVQLAQLTGARFVLHSNWRRQWPQAPKALLEKLVRSGLGLEFWHEAWSVPTTEGRNKAREISEWLRLHRTVTWRGLVIDDVPLGPLEAVGRFELSQLRPSRDEGFGMADYRAALAFFGASDNRVSKSPVAHLWPVERRTSAPEPSAGRSKDEDRHLA